MGNAGNVLVSGRRATDMRLVERHHFVRLRIIEQGRQEEAGLLVHNLRRRRFGRL